MIAGGEETAVRVTEETLEATTPGLPIRDITPSAPRFFVASVGMSKRKRLLGLFSFKSCTPLALFEVADFSKSADWESCVVNWNDTDCLDVGSTSPGWLLILHSTSERKHKAK